MTQLGIAAIGFLVGMFLPLVRPFLGRRRDLRHARQWGEVEKRLDEIEQARRDYRRKAEEIVRTRVSK